MSLIGGERGIRTLDGLFLTHTPLAGERLQPLGHLSKNLLVVSRGAFLKDNPAHSYLSRHPQGGIVSNHLWFEPFGRTACDQIRSRRICRTLDGLFLTHTPLAGERLQPLGHLSKFNYPVLRLTGAPGAPLERVTPGILGNCSLRCPTSCIPAVVPFAPSGPSPLRCDVLIRSRRISQPLGHLSKFYRSLPTTAANTASHCLPLCGGAQEYVLQ